MTTRKKIPLVRDVFLETLSRTALDEARFDMAKTMLAKGRRIEEWGTGGVFDEAAHAVVEGRGDPVTVEQEMRDICSVSHEDVRALVQEYLLPDNFTVVILEGSAQ